MKMVKAKFAIMIAVFAVFIILGSQSALAGWIVTRNCDDICGCVNGACQQHLCENMVCSCQTYSFGEGACVAGSSCHDEDCACEDADNDGYCGSVNDCVDSNGAIHPGAMDACNGINLPKGEDCNLATADGSGETAPLNDNQLGVCAGKRKTCGGINGWVNNYLIIPYYEQVETLCDNKDNDCDGDTDPGCECVDGTHKTAVCGQGVCYNTVQQTCVDGQWIGECVPLPYDELIEVSCNNADDDCDGYDDNTQGTSVPYSLTEYCYEGPAGTEGIGECHGGARACTLSGFGACDGDVVPTPMGEEVCDGKDEDCNGQIDEDFTAADGSNVGDTCAVGLGICRREGAYECGLANSVVCNAEPGLSSTEICNGLDDDCNGMTDEGCDSDNDGYIDIAMVCEGTPSCSAGEISGESVECYGCVDWPWDRDCDDEPGDDAGQYTNPRIDIDSDGNYAEHINPGAPEACDGIDNDCDGIKDIGCSCTEGEETECMEYLDGTGICKSGTQQCEDGIWGECTGYVAPETEICGDDIDQDCNGNDPVCQGYKILIPITFNVTVENTKGIIAYMWDFGDGSIFGTPYADEALPVTHTYTSAREKSVYFRMMDKGFKVYEARRTIQIDLSEEGELCITDDDCSKRESDKMYCNPEGKCSIQNCTDNWKNQDEVDVDCGGSCIDEGKRCFVGQDCDNGDGNENNDNSTCMSNSCFDGTCMNVENACTVGSFCQPNEGCLFSMGDYMNSHAYKDCLYGNYQLCCREYRSADGGTRILGISAEQDEFGGAVVEEPLQANYADGIYINGGTTCRYREGSCHPNEECIAGISAKTNANVSSCDDFWGKICCPLPKFYDYFSGGSINTNKWTPASTPANTFSIRQEDGKLVMSKSQTASGAYSGTISSKIPISGNFVMEMNYTLINLPMPTAGYSDLRMQANDGSKIVLLARRKESGMDKYKAEKWDIVNGVLVNYALLGESSVGAEQGRTAKMRLERIGSALNAYYSHDGGAIWTLVGTTTISAGSAAYLQMVLLNYNTGDPLNAKIDDVVIY